MRFLLLLQRVSRRLTVAAQRSSDRDNLDGDVQEKGDFYEHCKEFRGRKEEKGFVQRFPRRMRSCWARPRCTFGKDFSFPLLVWTGWNHFSGFRDISKASDLSFWQQMWRPRSLLSRNGLGRPMNRGRDRQTHLFPAVYICRQQIQINHHENQEITEERNCSRVVVARQSARWI